jgi:hypothetical protein
MIFHTPCLIRVKSECNYNFCVKGVKILLTHMEVNFGAHVRDVFVKCECGSGERERERGCESSCVCVCGGGGCGGGWVGGAGAGQIV